MSANLAENNFLPSRQEAAKELLRRDEAKQSLLAFTEYTTHNWKAGKIHKIICEQLERVERKEIDRLMLLCPPQHGKSQITSRRYPAYLLGCDPRRDVIAASATAELADGFGRDVRNCVASPEYQNVFPGTELADDSQAKGRWNTKQGGAYIAVGIGAQLYGKGGMGLIDDPFGSWADAQSALQRDKVWEWYQGTFYNRIRPGEPIIAIQHRMHEEDLVGRLLEKQKQGGDKWEVVELPATIDDPPWIERYDSAALLRIKANTDPRQWSALYMQNPTPDEGTYFKREWFKFYKEPPKIAHHYMSSDFAVTEGGGDFTEIATHAVDANDDLYLAVDAWYGQTSSDVWIDQVCNQIIARKPFAFFGESGSIRRSIEPFLIKRMRERKAFCRVEWVASIADKPTRARALQSRAAMGKVYLPDTDYGHRLLAQFLAFPAGKFDDAVDMASLMALVIDQAHPAIAATAEKKQTRDDYEREDEEDSWKVA